MAQGNIHLHLYRKYRPKLFSDLIGQNHIQTTLRNEVRLNKVGHAYVFSGPRGLGKTSTARILSKAVNCSSPKDGEPDLTCGSCAAHHNGIFLDSIEIDAASHTGVDNVRENIIGNARIAPMHGKKKVFIIDEVHMLSISAFNALLKTLEEPPKDTIFILATTEIHKVPDTIVSRCERFDFKRIQPDVMRQRLQRIASLEGREVDGGVLDSIARISEGCQRDAENLLDQMFSLDEKRISMDVASLILPQSSIESCVKLTESFGQKNVSGIFQLIEQWMSDGVHMDSRIKELIEFWRKLLVLKIHRNVSLIASLTEDLNLQKIIQEIMANLDAKSLIGMIESLIAKQELCASTPIPPLPLELTAVECCVDGDKGISGSSGQGKIERGKEQGSKQTLPAAESVSVSAVVREKSLEGGGVMHDRIIKEWATILKECRKFNHALMLTLKVASIVHVHDDRITLGFRYKFYQDRVLNPANQQILINVFSRVLGKRIIVDCEIDASGKFPLPLAKHNQPLNEKTSKLGSREEIKDSQGNVWEMVTNTFGKKYTQN